MKKFDHVNVLKLYSFLLLLKISFLVRLLYVEPSYCSSVQGDWFKKVLSIARAA